MMNREIRRAQAKQDKKAEREKEERRAARRRKVEQLRSKRAARRAEARASASAKRSATATGEAGADDAAKPQPKKTGRMAGRFSGALMMATIFFIVLQSTVPPEEGGSEVLRTVTGAGFFLLFGYFSVLWLMRRGVPRPLMMTWITGAMLVLGVEAAKAIQGVLPFEPLIVALALPAVVGGSYLGRLVFDNTPA